MEILLKGGRDSGSALQNLYNVAGLRALRTLYDSPARVLLRLGGIGILALKPEPEPVNKLGFGG